MYPRILEKINSILVNSVNNYANRRWYKSPLTTQPLGTREQYLKIAEDAKLRVYPIVNEYENKLNSTIDLEWMHQLALHTQIVIKKSTINYQHGCLLYSFLSNYLFEKQLNNINIIETGTARGFSSLCMAKALADSNTFGKIVTFDVLPHHHKMYWNCIDDLEGKKTRSELLNNYHSLTEKYIVFHQGNSITELPKVQLERIHFAFLDAAHNYYHLIREFNQIESKQLKGDIIFFDDYTKDKYPSLVKAIDEICEKHNYSKEVIKADDERAYVVAEKL